MNLMSMMSDRKRGGWCVAAAVLAALVIGGCGSGEAPQHTDAETPADAAVERPNILLISVDTLRPDRLSCYGHRRPSSPVIDRLAREGALFENVVSSTSWTLPAHGAMFTGLVDSVHGCLETDTRLDESRHTLAERLSEAGYETVNIFSGPLLHPVFGLSQGFEHNIDCTGIVGETLHALQTGVRMDNENVRQASVSVVTSPTLHASARNWLEENEKSPFFIFIHMWDPHYFYIPPPPFDELFDRDYGGTMDGRMFFAGGLTPEMPRADLEHVLALYDGEIAWTDHFIGRILADLRRLGLEESTVVMLLSDHGEEFYEHGLRGHRLALFEESIRIPLIVRWPGRVPAGLRLPDQASMIDVLPTLLDLAGVPVEGEVMGRSLAPLFEGRTLPPGPAAVSELFSLGNELRSFRRNGRKMIDNEALQRQLYIDLETNPGEQQFIREAGHPKFGLLVSDAREAMRWIERFRTDLPVGNKPPTLPEDLKEQLVELGYLEAE